MSLAAALKRADELGAKGEYFEAHEELEAFWMKAAGAEKVLLQGLIQVAAGLHRLRLNPSKPDGANYLLDRGLAKVAKHADLLDGASFESFEKKVRRTRSSGRAPETLTFGLKERA